MCLKKTRPRRQASSPLAMYSIILSLDDWTSLARQSVLWHEPCVNLCRLWISDLCFSTEVAWCWPPGPPWSPGLVTALGVTPVMPGPALSPAQPPSSSLIPELCSVSSLQLSSVPQPRPLRHHLIISTSHAISSDFIRVDILNYKWLRMCVCEWVSQVRLRVNWWILAVTNHLMSVKWN